MVTHVEHVDTADQVDGFIGRFQGFQFFDVDTFLFGGTGNSQAVDMMGRIGFLEPGDDIRQLIIHVTNRTEEYNEFHRIRVFGVLVTDIPNDIRHIVDLGEFDQFAVQDFQYLRVVQVLPCRQSFFFQISFDVVGAEAIIGLQEHLILHGVMECVWERHDAGEEDAGDIEGVCSIRRGGGADEIGVR